MKTPLWFVLLASFLAAPSAFSAEKPLLSCSTADSQVTVEVLPEQSSAGWPDFREVRYFPVTVTADAGSVTLRGQGDPAKPELGLFGLDEGQAMISTYGQETYLQFKRDSQLAAAFQSATLEKYYDGVRSFTSRGYKVLLRCQ